MSRKDEGNVPTLLAGIVPMLAMGAFKRQLQAMQIHPTYFGSAVRWFSRTSRTSSFESLPILAGRNSRNVSFKDK